MKQPGSSLNSIHHKNIDPLEAANEDIFIEEDPSSQAKEVFEELFANVERLRANGDSKALRRYIQEMHDKYFASSDDLFSRLSLKENFEVLLQINKIDELQGPIGQAGVGQLVLRLASFQYAQPERSSEKISSFIEDLLKNKNISEAVEVLIQLQTVAAQGLANGDWSRPVYDGIRSYLETHASGDVFIITKLKDRLDQRLAEEESDPSMGILTTLDNKHQGLMFENNIFDDELNARINELYSFGGASKVRVSQISRDYLGIFDTRNRLLSLVPVKDVNTEKIKNSPNDLTSIETYIEASHVLKSRKHIFNKTLDLFFRKIVSVIDDARIIEQFADVLGMPPKELVDSLQNEIVYQNLYESGLEVDAEVVRKSDAFFARLKAGGSSNEKINALEDTLYATFNEKFAERKNKRKVVDVLNLTGQADLGFLGLDESNIELFKVIQDPYFTRTIQETFGINLADLDIRAQSAFLTYFSKATASNVEEFSRLITTFAEKDRVKICSSYLAFEADSDLGYIIEKLCERPEVAHHIIGVVYDLIGNAGKIEDFLLSEFKTGSEHRVIASVYKKLIEKAKAVLLKYNAKIMDADTIAEIASGAGMLAEYPDIAEEFGLDAQDASKYRDSHSNAERRLVEEARSEISSLNTNQILFLNAFKSLKETHSEFSLDDINNSSFTEIIGSDIPPEQAAEMKTIYSGNQSGNVEVQKELISNFEKRLLDGKTRFYTFSYDKHVQSFIAFTPQNADSSYVSAFNVAPNARGYKIGEAMLHEAMDKEARGHALLADSDSKLPISSKYIETGWVATRFWDDHGDKILDIARDDRERGRYASKGLTQEDIAAGRIPGGALVKTAKKQKDLPFELCNEGYMLTRMFLDQKTSQHYAVFEPAPPARRETETAGDASHKLTGRR